MPLFKCTGQSLLPIRNMSENEQISDTLNFRNTFDNPKEVVQVVDQ